MIKVAMLVLPAVAIIFFVAFKMPPGVKDYFFMVPTWLTSTFFAYIIGHSMHGVMGGYAGILCDFVLMPAFHFIKKGHERKKERLANPDYRPRRLRLPKVSFQL